MKLLTLAIFLCTTGAFAQGLIGSSVRELPATLDLQHGGFIDRVQHVVYIEGRLDSGVEVRLPEGLLERLEIPAIFGEEKLHCKGAYRFGQDRHGMQLIIVERLDLCLDHNAVPQYVRVGISRQDYDRLFDNLSAEITSSPMGGDRVPKEVEEPVAQDEDGGGWVVGG